VRKFHGTKVLGTFAPQERKFHRSESSMERKFLDFSLPGIECSTERKFHGSESSLYGLFAPWNESSWTFRSPGANVPRNESFTGEKVLSMVFSLPGTKVQRNEKASYRYYGRQIGNRTQAILVSYNGRPIMERVSVKCGNVECRM